MKKFSTVALVTGLTLGLGSIGFAAEPAPANGPNATTNTEAKTPAQAQPGMNSNVNGTTGSGMSTSGSKMSGSTSGAASGTIAPGTPLSNKEKQDHQTINGGPAVGK